MSEDLSNLENLESELEKLEIKDEFSNNLEDYFIKLIEEINYYKNELNKTNQKINNLEILMTNYRKEYFLLENNFLNLKQNYEEINNKNVTK